MDDKTWQTVLGYLLGAAFAAVIVGYAVGYHAGRTDERVLVPVCQEDQVLGTDGSGNWVCLVPGQQYVEYVPGVGWVLD